jgi:Flp pilus assembly protein TadB
LDLDIKQLEKERSENLKKADSVQQKTKVEEGYKKKMKELEDKLKDLKKKDQEQNGMMRESTK